MKHVVIPGAYPDEPKLHLAFHDDGDIGVAVAHGDRWPGLEALTLSSTTPRTRDAWEVVAKLREYRCK